MTQLKRISQRSTKPASAPSFVVTISSPEPTIAPETMMPGPISRRRPARVRGGSIGVCSKA